MVPAPGKSWPYAPRPTLAAETRCATSVRTGSIPAIYKREILLQKGSSSSKLGGAAQGSAGCRISITCSWNSSSESGPTL